MNARNKWISRVFAVLMALVLSLSALPIHAIALEDWQQLSITISWTDALGMTMSVQAMPVTWSMDQSFWAMIPADAPMAQLTVTMMHPSHAYTFDPASGSVLLQPMDAGATMDLTRVITIRAMEDGQFMDTFNLYLSTTAQEPTLINAQVPVVYRMEDGTELDRTTQTVTQGQENAITPQSGMVGDYDLVSDGVVYVTVNPDGSTSPAEVSFTYRAREVVPVTSQVSVVYEDENGTELNRSVQTVTQGQENLVYPMAGMVTGYELVSESPVQVTVNADGTVTPDQVTFRYRSLDVQPTAATISVYYLDEQGMEIASMQNISLENGDHTLSPTPADLPGGYTLISPAAVSITVAGGVANPDTATFVYRLPAAQPTDTPAPAPTVDPATEVPVISSMVQVIYQDQQGNTVSAVAKSVSSNAPNAVTPAAVDVPAGYELVAQDAVTVMVDANGTVTPPTVTFTVKAAGPQETPIPFGAPIKRYASTNATKVRIRKTPGGTILDELRQGTVIWALQQVTDDAGSAWTRVMYNGQIGYIDSSFVIVMTQAESDAYFLSTGGTPVPEEGSLPTDTPVPTDTPPPAPADTPVPTATPAPAPVDTPYVPPITAAPVPIPYSGFVLTTEVTALRSGINVVDTEIISRLDTNTLMRANLQVPDSQGRTWSLVTTLDNQSGFVLDSALKRITQQEAAYYIAQFQHANATPVPTPTPTPVPAATPPMLATPQPMQVQGYAVTIGDDVYFRNMPSTMSDIKDVLTRGVVVYVNGQQYEDGVPWHIVQYKSTWGYIRADLLRMMTVAEENQYLNSQNTPAPTPVNTPQPLNNQGMSSYGYVTAQTVNFRRSASTSSARIGTLKKFAFALVLGTTNVDGKTWYHISYNNTRGYVQGDYFKQMTIPEMQAFLNSQDYQTGILNNQTTTANQTASPQRQSGGQGGLISAEDQTVNVWTNPNSGLNVSYVPFNPYATIPPLEATTSPDPSASPEASPSDEPESTATMGELATIPPEPEQTDTQSGGGAGWLIVLAILILGGGGTYGYILYRKNQRIAAQRAAQRRANAQRAGQDARAMGGTPTQNGQRPGQPGTPMTPGSGQPRTGTYQQGVPTGTPQVRRPYVAPPPGTTPPAPGANQQSPYAAPGTNGNPPYSGSIQPGSSNYARPGAPAGSPYGQPAQPGDNPYRTSGANPPTAGSNPYATPVGGTPPTTNGAYRRPSQPPVAPSTTGRISTQGTPPQEGNGSTGYTRRSSRTGAAGGTGTPSAAFRPAPRKVDPYRSAEDEDDVTPPTP